MKWIKAAGLAFALALGACTTGQQAQFTQSVDALKTFTLADVDHALTWANFNNDRPAIQCLTTLRVAVAILNNDNQAEYGVLTWGQIASDLANPSSRLRADCAALAAERKAQITDVIAVIAGMVGGA